MSVHRATIYDALDIADPKSLDECPRIYNMDDEDVTRKVYHNWLKGKTIKMNVDKGDNNEN